MICRSKPILAVQGAPAGLGQPVSATVSNNNRFVAAVRSNFAILSEAATSEEGDTGDAESKLQIMVCNLRYTSRSSTTYSQHAELTGPLIAARYPEHLGICALGCHQGTHG